eukprot:gene14470-20491_t
MDIKVGAACVKPEAKAGTNGGIQPSHVQWNSVSLSSTSLTSGGGGSRRAKDLAAWAVYNKAYRMKCAVRSIAGLVSASRSEDRYGVVLLCEPTLADLVASLLSTILVLQQFVKHQTGSHQWECQPGVKSLRLLTQFLGWQHGAKVEEVAFALEDLARQSLYRIVNAFGPSLKDSLKAMKMKPAFGSSSDMIALLSAMVNYTE